MEDILIGALMVAAALGITLVAKDWGRLKKRRRMGK